MKQASEQLSERAERDAGQRFAQLLEELTIVEAFVSTRVAAIRAEVEALGAVLGLGIAPPSGASEPIDLPFRKPSALEAIPLRLYHDFFPGWHVGAGDPDVTVTVQQLPAPESALTFPNHRMMVRLRREGSKDIQFLTLELDAKRGFSADSRFADTAVRLRSKPRSVVKPSLRIFFEGGSWHDLFGAPYDVGADFRSHSTTFEIPEELRGESKRPVTARLLYYLASDAELELDLAYLIVAFRTSNIGT